MRYKSSQSIDTCNSGRLHKRHESACRSLTRFGPSARPAKLPRLDQLLDHHLRAECILPRHHTHSDDITAVTTPPSLRLRLDLVATRLESCLAASSYLPTASGLAQQHLPLRDRSRFVRQGILPIYRYHFTSPGDLTFAFTYPPSEAYELRRCSAARDTFREHQRSDSLAAGHVSSVTDDPARILRRIHHYRNSTPPP